MDQKSSSTFQKLKLLLTLPLVALVFIAFAGPTYILESIPSKNQTAGPKYSWKFVKGKVVKEDGSPVLAIIHVPQSRFGTATDASGNFEIMIPENSYLSIRFIGFKEVNFKPAYDREMIITLKTEIIRIGPIEIYPPNYSDNKKYLSFVEKGREDFRQTENTTDQTTITRQNEIPDVQFIGNKATINLNNALIVKDGAICANLKLEDIDPATVSKISYLNKESAIKKYGEIVKDGVIEVFSIEEEIIDFFEETPEFPGGITNLREILKTNLIYPEIALKKGIQGTVYVRFVVSEDGLVTQVKIENGVDQTLDDIVLQVVKNLPKWRPCKQRALPVKVSYEIPVRFRIPDDYHPKSAEKLKEMK